MGLGMPRAVPIKTSNLGVEESAKSQDGFERSEG